MVEKWSDEQIWEVTRAADDPSAVVWSRVAVLPGGAPLRLSADGTCIAVVRSGERVRAYIPLRSQHWEISLNPQTVEAWALTPDGDALLVVKTPQGRLHLFRVDGKTGHEVWRHPVPEGFAGMTVLSEGAGAGVVRLHGASIDVRDVAEGLRVRSVPVHAPDDVMVNKLNLEIELENLSYFIQD